ncbi:MAG: replicative DNA helicase [Brevinema sp.]
MPEEKQLLTVPHSLEAERAVLGAALVNQKALFACVEALTENDFYDVAHQKIFQSIVGLETSGSPVDLVSITNKLSRQGELSKIGSSTLVDLAERYTTVANIEHHIRIVKDHSLLRALISASRRVIDIAMKQENDVSSILDEAGSIIFDVVEKKETSEYHLLHEYIKRAFKQFEDLKKSGTALRGIPTGYPDIDNLTNGLNKGTLIVLAGRPGTGKTAFALNLARGYLDAANSDDPKTGVLFFSLEMTGEELALRMISAESRILLEKINRATIGAEEMDRFLNAMGTLSTLKLVVDDTGGISLNTLKARARSIMRKHKYSLMIIDHMQIITMPGQNFSTSSRTNMLASISGTLKALSKELEIPIIVLSQLNRGVEHRQDKTPMLADIRESGAIEQDADIVILISREDYYDKENAPFPGVVEVNFAKHRNGRTEMVPMMFFGETMLFSSLNQDDIRAYMDYKNSRGNGGAPSRSRLKNDGPENYSNPGF